MKNTDLKINDRVKIYGFGPSRVIEIRDPDECVIRGEGVLGGTALVWTRLLEFVE